MRHTCDHIHILVFLNLSYRLLYCFYRIFKQKFTCRRTFQGIFSKYTNHSNSRITLLNHNIIFHAVRFKRFFDLLLPIF